MKLPACTFPACNHLAIGYFAKGTILYTDPILLSEMREPFLSVLGMPKRGRTLLLEPKNLDT